MLYELHVTDLGVIEELDLSFHPGLNVLTGETGAGKTMVTVALALALGRRASGSLVRDGARVARVQARFDAPPAAEAAEWVEDGSLVLARTVDAAGRSAARVGGQIAPVSVLERLGADLVEVHGQHEGTLLRSTAAQTAFLDRFAGAKHLSVLAQHGEVHGRLLGARSELEELARTERDRERELDVLGYQVAEIDASQPRPGELAELEAEAVRLANAERLAESSADAGRALSTEGGAHDLLSAAADALSRVASLDPGAGELEARARALRDETAELARDVRTYRERAEADPNALDDLNRRIAAIRTLLRKYGETEEAVLEYLATARERAARLTAAGGREAAVEGEVRELERAASRLAGVLRRTRANAAPRLADAIGAELSDLGMPGAAIRIDLVDTGPTVSGTERAEFSFSGGPRQRVLPLAKVASGGELSRVMLASRSVLTDADAVATLVFDEVDAGIGGAAAAAVGRRLAALARRRQVIVVTHLPQIASFADRHVVVEKDAGRATARTVDGPDRVAELSRMLAGLPGSRAAATHAEELLAEAGRAKRA